MRHRSPRPFLDYLLRRPIDLGRRWLPTAQAKRGWVVATLAAMLSVTAGVWAVAGLGGGDPASDHSAASPPGSRQSELGPSRGGERTSGPTLSLSPKASESSRPRSADAAPESTPTGPGVEEEPASADNDPLTPTPTPTPPSSAPSLPKAPTPPPTDAVPPASTSATPEPAPTDASPPETELESDSPDGDSWALAFDASEPATFSCSLDGGAYQSCDSPTELTDLKPGWHTLSVRATDSAGNTDPSPATARRLMTRSLDLGD